MGTPGKATGTANTSLRVCSRWACRRDSGITWASFCPSQALGTAAGSGLRPQGHVGSALWWSWAALLAHERGQETWALQSAQARRALLFTAFCAAQLGRFPLRKVRVNRGFSAVAALTSHGGQQPGFALQGGQHGWGQASETCSPHKQGHGELGSRRVPQHQLRQDTGQKQGQRGSLGTLRGPAGPAGLE